MQGRNLSSLTLTTVMAVPVLLSVLAGAWWVAPTPFAPLMALLLAGLLLVAVRQPFVVIIFFVVVSLFRLPDAFPALQAFNLPLIFGAVVIASLIWNTVAGSRFETPSSRLLRLFLVFFVIVTLGIPFAANRSAAWETWTGVYVKIGIMTLAISWLAAKPADFRYAARAFIISGAAVGAVALMNWTTGRDLVEGSRAAIGTAETSMLSDPNDLALVLLFPLSFTLANLSRGVLRADRLLAWAALPVLVMAIVATQSRGALLGVLTVLAVVGSRKIKSRALVVLICLAAAPFLYEAMDIAQRTSGGKGEPILDESAEGRLIAWRAALNMAIANPLTGVGLNNFALSFSDYTPAFVGRDLAPHSTWFGVLGETGLPGLAVFVLMISAMISTARRCENELMYDNGLRAFATALIAGTWGYCVAGSFLTQGFTWPLYVFIGLTAGLQKVVTRGGRGERSNAYAIPYARVSQDVNRHERAAHIG